jgi:hypothetical protein
VKSFQFLFLFVEYYTKAEKKTPFLVQHKQIFGLSYLDGALGEF